VNWTYLQIEPSHTDPLKLRVTGQCDQFKRPTC